ncbi:MAG: hypothetical protein IID33_00850 [Planctomycetes bacterium]|nr:hypothetical protein [Planctomycetota bacterium]
MTWSDRDTVTQLGSQERITTAATNSERAAGRGGPRAMLIVTSVVLLSHAAMVLRFWWVTDDAYISFRYARNLALGEGIRYNLWDLPPVEGYSNFLWVVLAGVVHALGLDMVRWMPILSWVCGAGLLTILLHRLVRGLEVPLPIAAAAVLGLACYPPFAVWTTSGLATMPFALLVFLTFDRLLLARSGPDWLWGGVFGALLALIRVEGAAWFGVVLVLAVLGQAMRRRFQIRALLGAVLIVVLVFGGYFAWRYSYYGELLPNTVYAKSVSGPSFYERGYRYVMANVLTFLTPLVIVPAGLLALRRKRIAVGLGVAALASAFPVYAVVVAGDYLPMGRFLIPGLAFTTILLAWMLADLAGKSAWRTVAATTLGVAVGLLGALPGWDVHVVPPQYRAWCNYRNRYSRKTDTEYTRWVDLSRKVNTWRRRGRLIRAYAEDSLTPPVSMAIRAMGAIGYETDFNLYDCAGLTVPEIARREITEWTKQPGHDKAVDLGYFVKERPTILHKAVFRDDVPQTILKRVRKALREWSDREVRANYRPELVRMTSIDGEDPPKYFLVLVKAEQPTAVVWRSFNRMTPRDVAQVREISY